MLSRSPLKHVARKEEKHVAYSFQRALGKLNLRFACITDSGSKPVMVRQMLRRTSEKNISQVGTVQKRTSQGAKVFMMCRFKKSCSMLFRICFLKGNLKVSRGIHELKGAQRCASVARVWNLPINASTTCKSFNLSCV